IAKGKLTGLEQILDVAIQFAWGLHAIHERGLIHQDVKPGNVLMTSDGVPMVTDFGLARARLRAADGGFVSPDLPPGQQSVLVSSGGMTPAYASPEQRSGKPLSRKTDIWSWGVSVLDMFMGGVSCPHGGHIAADVLANLKESGQAEQWLPQVPDAIAVALGRCFDRDPAARWRDLAQSIEALKQAAPSLICRCATLPSFIEKDYYKYIFTKTRRIGNAKWRDPSEWLRVAYAAVGGTPPIDFTAQRHSSANRLSAGVDDLRILEEAQSVLEKGIAKGTKVLRILLAALFADKALVLVDVDDTTGAVLAYDQGARILESVKPPLPGYEDDLAAFLADFYMHKGLVLSGSRGLKREAVEPLDKSIAIYTKLVAKRHSTEVVLRLARALGNKARLLRHVTETEGALRLYEQAMSLLQAENPDVVEEDMARLCSNTGVALCDAHRERDGLPYLNRAIDLYSSMSQRSMRPDWMSLLANACTNKAAALI
ncbi:MAG: hypothetical protein EOM24_26165, partial [Chloroflexia bacterium]|nr:hypothetical protein [Chloroflexia bacterium]